MKEKVKEGIMNTMEDFSEDENMFLFYDRECDKQAQINRSISYAKEDGIKIGIMKL